MKISVYDTYIKTTDDVVMHFDILVEESKTLEDVLAFGKDYLKSKSIINTELTTKQCQFCHIETASLELAELVLKNGYSIIEMENC